MCVCPRAVFYQASNRPKECHSLKKHTKTSDGEIRASSLTLDKAEVAMRAAGINCNRCHPEVKGGGVE